MQPELSVFLQAIQAFGVIGVLGWLVMQFKNGKIVPRSVVDEIIENHNQQTIKAFSDIIKRLDRIVVVCPFGHDSAEIRRSLIKALEEADKEKP